MLAHIFSVANVVVVSREVESAQTDDVESQRKTVNALATRSNGCLHFLCNDKSTASFSSSAIREAVSVGQSQVVQDMLPEFLHEFVTSEGLYTDRKQAGN